jgi:ribonuclease J
MLKILPLGGIGKVTNNMYVYEYSDDSKTYRLIVDCGIGFPEEEMLGADILIPDVSYLEGKEDSIVGIVLTHGHDDHIAALPYIYPLFGKKIPIYASALTAGFAQDDLEEFGIKEKIQLFPELGILELGPFTIDPIIMTHSVPDTRHLVISTPEETIYHGSDYKIDWNPVDQVRPDLQKVALYGSRGVDCLLLDCLRVESKGYSLSETAVGDQLIQEMRGVTGKVVVTTMSSNIHRIQQIINAALIYNRKIAFLGRSIEDNIKISQRLGFIDIPDKTIIHKRRISKHNPEHLCLIVAGSQGQIGSTLTRISESEHTLTRLERGDHVIFSADPIPGNEQNVYRAIDKISDTGATVSYHGLHVSGHASADEQRMMLSIINPKNVIPIGGTIRHMNQFRVLARSMGMLDEEIITPKVGEIIAFSNGHAFIDNRIKLKTVIVDGLGIGDVGPQILADRSSMAQSGIVVVTIPADQEMNITGDPDIITRGFVFQKHAKKLIEMLKDTVRHYLPINTKIIDWKQQREIVKQGLEKTITAETQREPLIEVVLVKKQ